MSIFKTIHRSVILLITGFIFLPLPGMQCFAQSQDSSEKGKNKEEEVECKLLCTTILVMAEVEVRDQWGEAVADLSHKDFIVIEDGVRQEIVYLQAVNISGENHLDGRYKLGYVPLNDRFDGKYRRVRIVAGSYENRKFTVRTTFKSGLKDGNDAELITRFGYYAIDPVKSSK